MIERHNRTSRGGSGVGEEFARCGRVYGSRSPETLAIVFCMIGLYCMIVLVCDQDSFNMGF